jgi:hypothetical protein
VTSLAGAPLGFVSRALSFGAFGITSDPAKALRVQLAAPADGAPGSVRALDADIAAGTGTGTPFLGLVAGPADAGGADLARGSPNYCFVAGTAPSASRARTEHGTLTDARAPQRIRARRPRPARTRSRRGPARPRRRRRACGRSTRARVRSRRAG